MIKKKKNTYNILLYVYSLFISYNILFSFHIKYKAMIVFALSIPMYFVIKLFFRFLEGLNIHSKTKFNKKEYFIYALVIIIPLVFAMIANYPYAMHNDLVTILKQAQTKIISNWHPIFYTFFMIRIPILIHNSVLSCVVLQCLIITLVLLYFARFCRRYFLSFQNTIFLLLLIVLNPLFLEMATIVLKDSVFTYFMMLGTIMLIEIYLTNGEWIRNRKNKILFIVMCVFMSNVRHNGIICLIAMIILLSLFYKKDRKFYLVFFVIYFAIRTIITSPIYNALGMDKNGGLPEIMGIPLNQISYIYNNGGKITKAEKKVMNNLVPLKDWEYYYIPSSFNFIRWFGDYSWYYLGQNKYKILRMWLKIINRNKKLAVESYLKTTYPIWGITWKNNIISTAGVYTCSTSKNAILMYNTTIYNGLLRYVIFDIGNSFCFLILLLILLVKKAKKNYKAYIPYVLVMSNALFIMCVIYGQESRLLYPSILCLYPLLVYTVSNKIKKA